MIMQEKERVTEGKTGILDPVIPGKTDMKKGEEKGTKMMEKPKSSGKIYYGETEEVNPVRHADCNDYLELAGSKQQLPGFDEEYRDIVDYVLKITHRIWEEKGIGVIYDTYHNDVTMHCASSNLVESRMWLQIR